MFDSDVLRLKKILNEEYDRKNSLKMDLESNQIRNSNGQKLKKLGIWNIPLHSKCTGCNCEPMLRFMIWSLIMEAIERVMKPDSWKRKREGEGRVGQANGILVAVSCANTARSWFQESSNNVYCLRFASLSLVSAFLVLLSLFLYDAPDSVTQYQFFIVVVSVSLDRERLFRTKAEMTICYSYTRARDEKEEKGEEQEEGGETVKKVAGGRGQCVTRNLGIELPKSFATSCEEKVRYVSCHWHNLEIPSRFITSVDAFQLHCRCQWFQRARIMFELATLSQLIANFFSKLRFFLLVTSRPIISFWTCSMFSRCTRRDYELIFRRLPGSFTPPAIFYSWFSSKRILIPFFKRLFNILPEK